MFSELCARNVILIMQSSAANLLPLHCLRMTEVFIPKPEPSKCMPNAVEFMFVIPDVGACASVVVFYS